MAFKYKVYKQLIPAPLNSSDPSWARRQVWVAKLNSTDTVDEYDTEAEAQTKKTELTSTDPTDRVYKVTRVLAPEVGTRPTEDNTKAEITSYMDDNSIMYASGDSKATLLEAIETHWNTPNEDLE